MARPGILFIAGPLLLLGACATSQQAEMPDQASIPKIDAHGHYQYSRDYLAPLLDAWNMRTTAILVVLEDTAEARSDWRAIAAHHRQHPEHIIPVTSFNATGIDEPDYADRVIAQLRQDIAGGARMVKVWKNIGMVQQDASGKYVQIDDPRFQPIWDFLVAEDVPVIAHIAEPIAAWLPYEEDRPHAGYFHRNPQYHAYLHPEIPRYETIIAARDNWLARNPDLTVIGAHLGSTEHDVDEVARRLDRFPNFYVETAARMIDLVHQDSEKVRDFMIKYQDRIMWGTDLGNYEPASALDAGAAERERARIEQLFAADWRYFTQRGPILYDSPMSGEPRQTAGLHLPEDVLRKIYAENFERVVLER